MKWRWGRFVRGHFSKSFFPILYQVEPEAQTRSEALLACHRAPNISLALDYSIQPCHLTKLHLHLHQVAGGHFQKNGIAGDVGLHHEGTLGVQDDGTGGVLDTAELGMAAVGS